MLQMADGWVQSIMDIRPLKPELNDIQFAAWYSQRYRITEKRVLSILEFLKGETE